MIYIKHIKQEICLRTPSQMQWSNTYFTKRSTLRVPEDRLNNVNMSLSKAVFVDRTDNIKLE